MQFIYKIPGYLLLLFGGFCLSWGGLIVRSFENATAWQILFLRSFFFLFAVTIFLLITYKKNAVSIIKKSGYAGVLGGLVMSLSFVAFVFAVACILPILLPSCFDFYLFCIISAAFYRFL